MKKFLLLFAVLVLIAGIAATQNKFIIAGYVTNDSTGAPINNHMVYIMTDSSQTNFNYYASVTSDITGLYYDSIPIPDGQVIPFIVSTYDCNQQFHQQTVYSGNGSTLAIVNFSICEGAAPPLCTAYFFSSNDSNYYANQVEFFDYSTPAGQISSWLWCFSDPLSGTSNYSTLQNPTHYFFPGTYNVCLTIATSFGCSSIYCHSVIITGTSSGCQAAFTIVPDSVPNTLTYNFYDQSTGNPSSWIWSFGDGTTSTLQNPVHSYNAYGIYFVSLDITGDSCQSTATDTLVINGNPVNCSNWFT